MNSNLIKTSNFPIAALSVVVPVRNEQHNLANLIAEIDTALKPHITHEIIYVYGGNTKLPFSEQDNVNHPVSLYAATKKLMSLWHTLTAILTGTPIKIFNHGYMMRDFTYIDDIVEGLIRVLDKPATVSAEFNTFQPVASISHAPYRIFNIGHSKPEKLMDFIQLLEVKLGKTAKKEFLPMQAGDVQSTYADTTALEAWIGFKPETDLKVGVRKFVAWYKSYF